MSTAEAIESMTDAGQFEILATRILRQIDSDYARIEHLGVNSEGKTIKNPLDGFCRVPGSRPSRYVMAAFSTDAADRVERKLLFDHKDSSGRSYTDSDDGDLIKAARSAAELKMQDGDAEFIFTFCTNKQPNKRLMESGYAAANTFGIELRFLARSSIRDHLDTTPNGQWLRKEHLGIDADMMSIPLLRELADRSLRAYSYELFCSDTQIVETATTKRLAEHISQRRQCVSILIGSSGSGKSVASYKVITDVLANGGIAIWIPAEIIENSVSLFAAMSTTLKQFYPTLGAEAGRDSVTLTADQDLPFVIVVDDVNRTKNPSRTLQQLTSWYRRMAAAEADASTTKAKYRIPELIIPVWNHHWPSLARFEQDRDSVAEFSAQMMTPSEAVMCLRASSKEQLDQGAATEVVQHLEYDPILISLWSKMFGDKPAEHLHVKASTLIESYIQASIKDDAASCSLIPADIRSAFETLSAKMLEYRDFYPPWSKVLGWLNSSEADAIRCCCKSGKICRVVSRNNNDRLEFRHDRVLETALANPIRSCLANIKYNQEVLGDPFFTNAIAHAVAATENPTLVAPLSLHAPLAILQTIRHIAVTGTEFAEEVTRRAREWLTRAITSETVPREIVFAASRILLTTRSPLVLEVTKGLDGDRHLSGARLVNGDAVSGKYFVTHQHIFFPAVRAPDIEDIVDIARRAHHDQLCRDLSADLVNRCNSEDSLSAALILAGYIGDCSLAEPALLAWKRDKDNKCLLEALWAAMRCSVEPEATLAPILDSWATLSNETDENGRSERTQVVSQLGFCMRHGINEDTVQFLVDRASHDDRLSSCLTALLKEIDHPSAVTFLAMKIARSQRVSDHSGAWSFVAWQFQERWDPLRPRHLSLSGVSRNALRQLWQECDDESLQKSLLDTWVNITDSAEELTALPEEFATCPSVLWRRARIKDRSIVENVLERVSQDSVWWQVVPPIWTDQFDEALDQALETLGTRTPTDFSGGATDNHYILSDVLRDIPLAVAERLLLKNWESLKYSARFVQIALYVGGDALLSAADKVIQTSPTNWVPLEHIGMTFGLHTKGLQDRVSDKHIDALLPYCKQLDDMELIDLAEWLTSHRREKDFYEKISPEIRRRVVVCEAEGENSYIIRLSRLRFPSDDDLLRSLTEIDVDERNIWSWCHFSAERQDVPERTRTLLRKWMLDAPSPKRLKIMAKIMGELGYRDDVVLLQQLQSEYGDKTTELLVEGVSFRIKYRSLS